MWRGGGCDGISPYQANPTLGPAGGGGGFSGVGGAAEGRNENEEAAFAVVAAPGEEEVVVGGGCSFDFMTTIADVAAIVVPVGREGEGGGSGLALRPGEVGERVGRGVLGDMAVGLERKDGLSGLPPAGSSTTRGEGTGHRFTLLF